MLVINTLIQLRKNMSKNNKSGSTPHDWKKFPKKQFSYKSIEDPEYIKERNAFFKENGVLQRTEITKFITKLWVVFGNN